MAVFIPWMKRRAATGCAADVRHTRKGAIEFAISRSRGADDTKVSIDTIVQ
jgi:hypothetical protein